MRRARASGPVAPSTWPAIELRELHVFLVVAQELHFGRAAERLGINASRVSQIIQTLEAKLGGRLFERTSRRVRVTAIGEQVLVNVTPAYLQLQQALRDALDGAAGVAGTLRIGTYVPGLGGHALLEIAQAFETAHPACKVAFLDIGLVRPQLDRLRCGELDLLVMRLPISAPEVAIGPVLTSEQPVLAVADHHPLASKASITYEELAPYRVTDARGLPREMIDQLIPPRTPSGSVLQRLECASVPEALMQTAVGDVVHVTVPSVLEQLRVDGITMIPISDRPPSRTALIWLKANHSAKLAAFIQTASAVLDDIEVERRPSQPVASPRGFDLISARR